MNIKLNNRIGILLEIHLGCSLRWKGVADFIMRCSRSVISVQETLIYLAHKDYPATAANSNQPTIKYALKTQGNQENSWGTKYP